MPSTAVLAVANCDDQAKPALACPEGYTMSCVPVGGDHWACAKLINGQFVMTSDNSHMQDVGVVSHMTVSDLGIPNVGMLPNNPLYFLKEWGRKLNRFFIFDKVKKTEFELKVANEKAAELLELHADNPNNSEAIFKAEQNYQQAMDRLKDNLERLKDNSQNPNVQTLIDRLDERISKHQDLFTKLEERHFGDTQFETMVMGARDKMEKVLSFVAEKNINIQQKAQEAIKSAEVVITELQIALPVGSTNRIACNENIAPVCEEPKILECLNGEWVCVGPASPGGIIDMMSNVAGREIVANNFLEQAQNRLVRAKENYDAQKYGEAFGQARSAEALARAALHMLEQMSGMPSPPSLPSSATPPQACTQEAMVCPDGSYVGRTGPNCEFEPCPK